MGDLVLEQMMRQRDELAARISAMDESISIWRKANEGQFFAEAESGDVSLPDRVPSYRPSPYDRLALPAAVHKVLELTLAREPKTATQISATLVEHGFQISSSTPVKSVQVALNRRQKTNKDVIHTGFGEWGLIRWYSESELRKFSLVEDGAHARDKGLHSNQMKRGIAAVRARGAHYGRAPKITEEMWDLAVHLFADKKKSTADVYPEILNLIPEGMPLISKTSFSNRKKQFQAREKYPDSWRAYFEEQRRVQEIKDSVEKKDAELRVIK